MFRRWCGLLLTALLLLAAPAGVLALSFQRVATIKDVGDIGDFPGQAMLLVNVDHDPNGHLDLVSFDNNSQVLKIYLGDGTGQFGAVNEIEVGESPIAVASGDLRGLGRTDFVVVDDFGSVTVLLQGENPLTFEPSVYDAFDGDTLVGVSIVELSGDEFLDLAVLGDDETEEDVRIHFLRNQGNGTFVPFDNPTFSYPGATPQSIVAGNFSADSQADLAISNFGTQGGGRIGQLVNTGNTTFNNRGSLNLGIDAELGPLVSADFNGDGKLDLATVDSNSSVENAFRLLLGNGDGTFAAQQTPEKALVEVFPISLATADFNKDDFPDVVTAHGAAAGVTSLSLLLSELDEGTYNGLARANSIRGLDLGSDSEQQAVVAGDVNGDGRPDIVVLLLTGEARVLINRADDSGGTPSPGGATETRTPTVTITPGGPTFTFTLAPSSTPTPTPTPVRDAPFGRCDRALSTGKPAAIVSADFNADRRPDLALADSTGARVLIVLNTADLYSLTNCNDAERPLAFTSVDTGADPRALAMGDLYGNGKVDLAVATSAGISLLRGSGTGTFIGGDVLVGGTDPRALLVQDIDRNGSQDIVVANAGSSDLSIFYGRGGGVFDPVKSIALGRAVNSVVAGQLNRDGLVDLAAAGGDITVLLQDPSIQPDGFRKLSRIPTGSATSALVAGDFNRDSIVDLATARNNGTTSAGSTETYQGSILNSGDPAYDPDDLIAVGIDPRAEGTADFSRNGKLDLVVANYGSNSLVFAQGDGTGKFPNRLNPFPVGTGPVALAVVDIDLDGQPDVVVANDGGSGAASISILLSSRPPPTPTPVDTDTPTPTGTPTPRGSESPTQTETPSMTPTVTPTFTRTVTLTPSLTPSISPTRTPTKILPFGVSGTCDSSQPASGGSLAWPAGALALGLLWRRRRGAFLALALATTLVGVPSLEAQNLPDYVTCYVDVGAATTRGTVGDFDRNGTPDLAVLTTGDAGLILLTNRADFQQGRCAEGITTKNLPSTGSHPSGIATADFNANGILGLAVTSRSGVTILNGDGAGNFASATPLPLPTPGISDPRDVAAAFLNLDVFPDLIVGDGNRNKVVLLYGSGGGSFTVHATLNVGDAVERVGSADLNRDGLADVVALDSSGSAYVFLQKEDGTFAQNGNPIVVSGSPVDFGIAVTDVQEGLFDFDKNTIPDLVFARRDAGRVSTYLGVLTGEALSYDEQTPGAAAGRPSALTINDFNGDTLLDVVTGDQSASEIRFFLGDGEGQVVATESLPKEGGSPTGLLNADVDNDGLPDVIVLGLAPVSPERPVIGFYLSSAPPPTASPTPTITPTATVTPPDTAPPTSTLTPTPTFTPTNTPRDTRTSTPTFTPTPTQTFTATITPVVAFALQGTGCGIGGSAGAGSWLWLSGLALLLWARKAGRSAL